METDPTHAETETETDDLPLLADDPAEPDPAMTGSYKTGTVEVEQRGSSGLILEVYQDGAHVGRTYMSHLRELAEHMDGNASPGELRRALEQYNPDD